MVQNPSTIITIIDRPKLSASQNFGGLLLGAMKNYIEPQFLYEFEICVYLTSLICLLLSIACLLTVTFIAYS
jgi:hypothetical protein